MFMSTAPTLRARHRDETRRLILATAREAFVRDGYQSLTMRELARRIGCSAGAIYLHFKGKEELLHCLVEESFARLLEALTQVPPGDDPVAVLKARLHAYVAFGLAYPYHYHFAFMLPSVGGGREQAPPLTPHAAFEVMRRSVAACQARGLMRTVDGEAASQALWAAVHGITSLLIARPDFPWVDRETLVAGVVEMAVDGLVAPRPADGEGGEHASDR